MKQKIQKSMMLILLVTLFPFYVIMTVILYNQNLGILEKEVQQEAAYLSSGVDVAGEEYLKKLEPMIKADETPVLHLFPRVEMFCMIQTAVKSWRTISRELK